MTIKNKFNFYFLFIFADFWLILLKKTLLFKICFNNIINNIKNMFIFKFLTFFLAFSLESKILKPKTHNGKKTFSQMPLTTISSSSTETTKNSPLLIYFLIALIFVVTFFLSIILEMNFIITLFYVITGAFSLAIAVLFFLSTQKMEIDAPNFLTFYFLFGFFIIAGLVLEKLNKKNERNNE